MGQLTRRRVKKRRRTNSNSKMKFSVFLAIIIITILLGYLTARFIIGPFLGYDSDESPLQVVSKLEESAKEENNDEEKKTEEEIDGGYALQFGVFSTREAADKLVTELAAKGIEAKIHQDDDMFKVISPIVKTKDEAIGNLDKIKDKEVEDVFIASF